MVMFGGKEYPIRAKNGTQAGFDGECFYMSPNFTHDYIKNIIVKTYKILANSIIKQKVGEYAKQMNVTPKSIKITNAKTRWGSCSGKNSVNFSWRLIMADEDVIDYVVVHELAHITEHNHSANFWKVVEIVLTDYKGRQKKLKLLQKKLSVQNWG